MDIKKRGNEDKWLYLAVMLLGLFFLFKLYNSSQIINQFPLDQNNDLSSYMGQLHFLGQYGFHQNVPNWYNGFTSFLLYPPGWFFFTLPIYLISGNILLATYISNILIYLIGFLSIFLLKKFSKFSWAETIFLYLFVFVNPIAVGNFIKLGRLPEMLSLSLFVMLFAFFLYYRDKKISGVFLLLSALYASVLLSHPAFFIISSFFIPPLFLIKKGRQRAIIVIMFFIALLLSSFWLIPFIASSKNTTLTQERGYTGLSRLLDFRKEFFFDNLFSFILPVVFLACFYFYCKSLKKEEKKKELIFYSIPIAFSILFFSRIAAFIPVINHPYPDSYNLFLIFISVFLFVKTPRDSFGRLNPLIKFILVVLPFLLIVPSLIFVSNFRQNNNFDKEIISILPEVGGRYLIAGMPYPTSAEAVGSYSAIYYNLSTPSGWYPQAASKSLLDKIAELRKEIENSNPNCIKINSLLSELRVDELILQKQQCELIQNCGLKEKIAKERICLLARQITKSL